MSKEINSIRRDHIVDLLKEANENLEKVPKIISDAINLFTMLNYGIKVKILRPHTYFVFPGNKLHIEEICPALVKEFIEAPNRRMFSLDKGYLFKLNYYNPKTTLQHYYESVTTEFVNISYDEYLEIINLHRKSKKCVSHEFHQELIDTLNQILTTDKVFDFTFAEEWR